MPCISKAKAENVFINNVENFGMSSKHAKDLKGCKEICLNKVWQTQCVRNTVCFSFSMVASISAGGSLVNVQSDYLFTCAYQRRNALDIRLSYSMNSDPKR